MIEAGQRGVSPWVAAAVLAVAGTAPFLNGLGGALVFDDMINIIENPQIRQLWPPTWVYGTGGTKVSSRAVVFGTLAANYALGGLNPLGYHAVNIAIHLVGGLALFGIVRRTLLLPRGGARQEPRATWLALAVALLWMVHPLQTQSVTYVIQRCESLMGMFYLLALYTLVRGATAERAWAWHLATVGCFWLGMLSKEVMATAVVVLPLYDRVFLADSWKEVLRRRGWVYLLFLPAVAWYAWLMLEPLAPERRASAGFRLEGITPWEYLRTQPGVILYYLRLVFWPAELCIDYGWPVVESPWEIYPQGAVILGLVGLSLWALWRRPALGFLGMAFFLILAPTSSFMPIKDLAFEHRMYLPLAAVAVLVVLTVDAAADRLPAEPQARRLLKVGAVALAAVLLAGRTFERNRDYRTPVVMWTVTMAQVPEHHRTAYNLGLAYDDAGQRAEAERWYRRALDLSPDNWATHYMLAKLISRRGEPDTAIEHLRAAIEHGPKVGATRNDLAILLAARGEVDEAARLYEEAIGVDPRYAPAMDNYGNLLARQGQFGRAIEQYRRAIAVSPNFALAHMHLGLALFESGEHAQAIELLNEARGRLPREAGITLLLVRVLATSGDEQVRNGAEAVRLGESLLEQGGADDPHVLDVLAAAYAEAGRFNDAVVTAQRAAALAAKQDNQALAEEITARLAGYRNQQPHRHTPRKASASREEEKVESGK